MDFNPILTEIQSHMAAMSSAAQAAVKMANPSLPSPDATAAVNSPSVLPPGTLLPHPTDEPPPGNITMPNSAPPLMPSAQPGVTAPRGTVAGETNEMGRLLHTGSGISQIGSKIENSRLGEAHPFLGKLLGGLAQGAATIGDTALSFAEPGIAVNTPGTAYHHQALVNQEGRQVNAATENAQKQAQAASENATAGKTNAETAEVAPDDESTRNLQTSEIEEHNAQVSALLHPQAKTDFEAWQQQNPNKPIEEWLKASQKATPETPQKETYDALIKQGMSPEQALERTKERPPTISVNAGEKNLWSVPQPDGTMKAVSIKAGDTIPKGAVSLSGQSAENSKAGSADEPTVAALKFANDYLSSGAFTGPSDEALQDQFFQLAKPSTGFRMNQAQISQLHEMASWMDSWKGRLYHLEHGTWFAPEQRANIVKTMNDLAASKGMETGGNKAPEGGAAENWVRDPKTGKLVKQ